MPLVVPTYGKGQLYFSIHPALWGTSETTGLSSKWEFSYEFATYWLAFNRGEHDDQNPSHRRCYKIADRRGCYRKPLVHGIGHPTEAGLELHRDVVTMFSRLARWYEQNGKRRPFWEEALEMDEIVPIGTIPMASVKIMQKLYLALAPDQRKHQKIHSYPTPVELEYTTLNGKNLLLTRCLHNHRVYREAFEALIKFGLVDLSDLPRPVEQMGKGRHPVGACLSETGARFYEDYAVDRDPMVIKELQFQQQLQERLSEDQM